ncbi:hypothetical protein L6164_035780 [Bauhinia variegata]|uniref:Uncharacterized protein n=1 Tax=Bauhinia variegata TaxID=167791 RepID=A0ACB9KF60_BAUVA|nr:hypothetical protein L6164_035780 [Bauhinia variegata]
MKLAITEAYVLLLWSCLLLISGLEVHDISYDYSATTECLVEPQRAHYGGGIIVNPGFDLSIDGWTVFGKAVIEHRQSKAGNRFIVALNRTKHLDSFSQKVQLEKGIIYSFSAWVQLSEGSEMVSVIFKDNSSTEGIHGGQVMAERGCWTLLKGGIVANISGPVDILFESKNTTVEIWVDSVSLQPFTKQQWRSHQDKSIDKVRKSRVRLQITHINETTPEGASVLITQNKPGFPFGCGMNHYILQSTEYQNWFLSRFTHTTFTNEMKWYSTEKKQGQENYTIADAMLKFAEENGISVRGHNIFWDNPQHQPEWVKSLSTQELQKATARRINSVVSRYKGELIAWDVVNENLHFSFYEDKLSQNASAEYYAATYQLDPKPILFLNEYNTIEDSRDKAVTAVNYKKKLEQVLSFPGCAKISAGIGLQGHFSSGQPNVAYMRSALDLLGTTGFPIWLTEVSVAPDPNQEQYLEEILREAYSHPAVHGIITFSGPAMAGFNETTLVDENFLNTPAGEVVDKLIDEWKFKPQEAKVDNKGYVDVLLFHGDYDVTVMHPVTNSSKTVSLSVSKDVPQETIVKIHT